MHGWRPVSDAEHELILVLVLLLDRDCSDCAKSLSFFVADINADDVRSPRHYRALVAAPIPHRGVDAGLGLSNAQSAHDAPDGIENADIHFPTTAQSIRDARSRRTRTRSGYNSHIADTYPTLDGRVELNCEPPLSDTI